MESTINKQIDVLRSGFKSIQKTIDDYKNSLDVFEFSTDKLCAFIDNKKFDFLVGIEEITIDNIVVMIDWGKDGQCVVNLHPVMLRKQIEEEANCSANTADKMIWNPDYRDAILPVIKDIIRKEY